MGAEQNITEEFMDAGQRFYVAHIRRQFENTNRVTSNGNLPGVPVGWEGEIVDIVAPFANGRTTNVIRVRWDNLPQVVMDMKIGDFNPYKPIPKVSRPVEQPAKQAATPTRSRWLAWLPSFGNGSSDN